MCDETGVGEDAAAWYVVRTKRYREAFARANLAQVRVGSYLPWVEEWPRPAVGNDVRPMFPGYLLVRAALPREFHKITRTPGVAGFVSFGGDPPALDGRVVEILRSREGADGVIRCGERSWEGREVRIVHGPFRGMTAFLERRLPARDRVLLLLQILQRPTRVELSDRWIAVG